MAKQKNTLPVLQLGTKLTTIARLRQGEDLSQHCSDSPDFALASFCIDGLVPPQASPFTASQALRWALAAGLAASDRPLADNPALSSYPGVRPGSTLLHVAATTGQEGDVAALLGAGCAVAVADVDGNTPLHLACRHGAAAPLARLLETGVDPDLPGGAGATPLLLACEGRRPGQVRVLLDAGADAQQMAGPRRARQPLLLWVAQAGHRDTLRALLPLLPDAATQVNDRGDSALHVAVHYGHTPLIPMLLDAGVDVDQRNDLGRTALMVAMEQGAAASIRALVAAGADLTLLDQNGRGVLSHAAANVLTVPLLGQFLESLPGSSEVLDAPDRDGLRPLHYAVGVGVEPVRMLLNAGADPNTIEELMRETALHLAAAGGDADMVSALVTAGADRTLRSLTGETACDVALRCRHQALLPLLDDSSVAATPTAGSG